MKRMHIATLRKLPGAGGKRAQARYVRTDGSTAVHNDRLVGIFSYWAKPRVEKGQPVEVRWTIAGGFWSDWVTVIP